MNILGISAGFHDAAISVISDKGDILFAGHSERYSKIKNDPNLCPDIVQELYGMDIGKLHITNVLGQNNYVIFMPAKAWSGINLQLIK